MGEKGYAETKKSPDATQVASQVSQVTFQFPVKSLGHSCWPFLFLSCAWLGLAWLAAALPGGLAGAGPGWLGRALAGGWLPSPAVTRLGAWRAWAGGLQHTQHTLTNSQRPNPSLF